MYETTYHRPKSVADAASLFSRLGDAAYISGGHTLLPAMKARLASPGNVIDLRHVPELKGVQVTGDRLADVLREPPSNALTAVEVTSPPPSWAPLKPLLLRFVQSYRERGVRPPLFGGVPLCLFGSEWPGFPTRGRTIPARGRCAAAGSLWACAAAIVDAGRPPAASSGPLPPCEHTAKGC